MKKLSLKKLIVIILAIILLIAGYFVLFQKPETAAADWWDDSWLYRQTVGITNSGTAETDFQVMITLDTTTLVTANKIQSDCDDIRVTDINGKLIPHWIEPTTCNTATTKIWTKVPSISTSGDTVYLYYGNSAVDSTSSTTDTFIREISGVQGAWDMDGTVGGISTGATLADSSGNTNTGTASNVNTTGMAYADSQFGQGVDFDGTDDYVVTTATVPSLDVVDSFTWSFWLYLNSGNAVSDTILGNRYGGAASPLQFIKFTPSTFEYYSNGGNPNLSYAIPTEQWLHLSVVKDGANFTYYSNGVVVQTGVTSIDMDSNPFYIGADGHGAGAEHTACSIDSVRIYNTALSQSEISDLYGTGGDRQGYVTTNYPNKSLVRKYSASVSVGSPGSEERGPGPVAYWKFDEGFGQTANDSTINANNGTLGGTSEVQDSDPTWQTEDMCVSGKCLKFDGVDDYVEVDDNSNLDLTNNFSICSWANWSNMGSDQALISKSSAYKLDTNISDYLRFTTLGVKDYTSTFSPELNKWYFICVVLDSSNDANFYIDGSFYQVIAGTASANTSVANLFIGKYVNNFNGSIDSVKIYPYARTAAQIKADYASRGTESGVSVAVGDEGKTSFSDGLVGYWKMDEVSWNGTADEVVDSSGSGNDGVAVGATGIPTTGAGKFGNGGVFDGVDDYVNCGNGSSLDITDAITIEAWTKTVNTTTKQMIVSKRYDSDYTVPYQLYYSSGSVVFDLGKNGTDVIRITGGTVTTNWMHIAATVSGNDMSLFVNGIIVNTETFSGTRQSNNKVVNIGAWNDWGARQNFFNGSIDSVRIYNRALSPGEVRDLYNFAPGPVGWWKMDEKVSGNGQTINDSSGYGNTGTTSSADGTGMDCMVPGKYGSACEFDGVDDYVDAGNDASLNITNAITISAWARIQELGDGLSVVFKMKNLTGDPRAGYWMYIETGNIIRAVFGADVVQETLSSNGTVDTNWHNITVTRDNDNIGASVKFYIDGQLDVERTSTMNWNHEETQEVWIGRDWSLQWFNGSIDDVRIYNYARTPSQIIEDYSAGAGRKQPIAHWKFDEGYGTTANNSGIGGTALNGTLTNMASPATSTSGWTDSGKIGKGLNFDGSSDYVDCGNDSSLNITDELTVEAWFYSRSWGSGNDDERWIVSRGHELAKGYDFGRLWTDNLFGFSIYTNPGQISASIAADTISLNEWHHAVGVFKPSEYIKLYIDGVLKTTTISSVPASIIDSETSLRISARGSITGYGNFQGILDDVKIYNYALTEDEVREEYNQGALLKLGSTGTDSSGNADDSKSMEYCIPGDTSSCDPPVGEWNFEEGAGSTVNDISGNNNTGTWSGTGSHWTNLGKISKGGVFNGSDDYVDCGSGSSLDITDEITVEAWVYSKENGRRQGIVGHNWVHNWGIIKTDWNNKIKMYSEVNDINEEKYSNSVIPLNEWRQVVIVYTDSDYTVRFYQNGQADGSGVFSGKMDTAGFNHPFYIGTYATSTAFFNGSIDQVRIYDYARTPAQIAWDYNRGKPVAHWKFNECQGGTAHDASGNGNDGTITIGVTGTQDGIGTCTDGDTSNAWYNGRTGKYNSGMSFDGDDDYVEATVMQTKTAYALWVKNGSIWEHVVNNDGTYYVNGIAGATLTSYPIYVSGTTVQIGKSDATTFVDCDVDNVKIYNYALTAEQIKTEYNGGAVNFE